MGLFDMFGAGGGSMQFQLPSPTVSPGSGIAGNVVFMGGKRAQQVTKVTVKLSMEQRTMQMTNQGMQPRTDARDVVPVMTISGPFQTTPGQPTTLPFQIAVPAGLPSTVPGQVTFHLRASADIDNEVDPGAVVELQMVGGAPMAAPMGGMPGMSPGAPMGGMPGMPMGGMPGMLGAPMGGMPGMPMGGMPGMPGAPMGGMPGMPMGGMPGMPGAPMGGMPGMPGAPMGGMPNVAIAVGTRVMAQWTDGQLHPAVVRAAQNGMYFVDWEEHHLGASSYVYPQQVQVVAGGHGMHPGMAPAMGKPMAPQHAQQPHVPGYDKGAGGYDKGAGGYDKHPGMGHDMAHGKGMAPPGGGLAIGAHVVAMHPSGRWAAARVVALQNGMVGVDWEDPSLGASSWVQPGQLQMK